MGTTLNTAFQRSTEPVFRLLTTDQMEQIVQFRADDPLQDRIDELAGKCTEGELTPEERAEYDGYVQANSFIATLQMRARKQLSAPDGV